LDQVLDPRRPGVANHLPQPDDSSSGSVGDSSGLSRVASVEPPMLHRSYRNDPKRGYDSRSIGSLSLVSQTNGRQLLSELATDQSLSRSP